MWGVASDWRTAASELRKLLPDLRVAADATIEAYPWGEGITTIRKRLHELESGDKSIAHLAEILDHVADSADGQGTEIEYTKVMIITSLAMLAGEIAACWLFPPTAPLEEAAATAATQVGLRFLRQRAMAAIERYAAKLGMAAVVRFAARHIVLSTVLGTGQDVAIQLGQMAIGHRKNFDLTRVGVTALTSAVAGGLGGPADEFLSKWTAKVPLPKGPWSTALRGAVVGAGAGMVGAVGSWVAGNLVSIGLDGWTWDPRVLTSATSFGVLVGGSKGFHLGKPGPSSGAGRFTGPDAGGCGDGSVPRASESPRGQGDPAAAFSRSGDDSAGRGNSFGKNPAGSTMPASHSPAHDPNAGAWSGSPHGAESAGQAGNAANHGGPSGNSAPNGTARGAAEPARGETGRSGIENRPVGTRPPASGHPSVPHEPRPASGDGSRPRAAEPGHQGGSRTESRSGLPERSAPGHAETEAPLRTQSGAGEAPRLGREAELPGERAQTARIPSDETAALAQEHAAKLAELRRLQAARDAWADRFPVDKEHGLEPGEPLRKTLEELRTRTMRVDEMPERLARIAELEDAANKYNAAEAQTRRLGDELAARQAIDHDAAVAESPHPVERAVPHELSPAARAGVEQLAGERAALASRLRELRDARDALADRLPVDKEHGLEPGEPLRKTLEELRTRTMRVDEMPERLARIAELEEAANSYNAAKAEVMRLADQLTIKAGNDYLTAAGARVLTDRVGLIDGQSPRVLVTGRLFENVGHRRVLADAIDRIPELSEALSQPGAEIRYVRVTVDSSGTPHITPLESPTARHFVPERSSTVREPTPSPNTSQPSSLGEPSHSTPPHAAATPHTESDPESTSSVIPYTPRFLTFPPTSEYDAPDAPPASVWSPTPQQHPHPEPKPHPHPTPHPEPGPHPGTGPHPASHPHPRPEPHPTPEPRPTPEPHPRPEPQPHPHPRPEPYPHPRPEPQPHPRPEPQPHPRPEPHPHPTPHPRPGPRPRPEPHPTPEPHPRPEPRPEPQPQPHPTPHPRPRPEPHPQPDPRPRLEPHPQPEPHRLPMPDPRSEQHPHTRLERHQYSRPDSDPRPEQHPDPRSGPHPRLAPRPMPDQHSRLDPELIPYLTQDLSPRLSPTADSLPHPDFAMDRHKYSDSSGDTRAVSDQHGTRDQPRSASSSGMQDDSRPDPRSAAHLRPEPGSRPEQHPHTRLEPHPYPRSEPDPRSELDPDPRPELHPRPEQRPTPDPHPDPRPESHPRLEPDLVPHLAQDPSPRPYPTPDSFQHSDAATDPDKHSDSGVPHAASDQHATRDRPRNASSSGTQVDSWPKESTDRRLDQGVVDQPERDGNPHGQLPVTPLPEPPRAQRFPRLAPDFNPYQRT